MKTTHEIYKYIGSTYTHSEDMKVALETLIMPTLTEPKGPADDATRTQMKMWEEHVKQHMKHEDALSQNLKSAYALIYGQSSNTLRVKVESRHDYDTLKANAGDVIGLLEAIKAVMFQFQAQHYASLALHKAKKWYYTLYQD